MRPARTIPPWEPGSGTRAGTRQKHATKRWLERWNNDDGRDAPPLLVHERHDGTYRVWAGMHRLAAAREVGLTVIPVVIMRVADLLTAGYEPVLAGDEPWSQDQLLTEFNDSRPDELREYEKYVHGVTGHERC